MNSEPRDLPERLSHSLNALFLAANELEMMPASDEQTGNRLDDLYQQVEAAIDAHQTLLSDLAEAAQ